MSESKAKQANGGNKVVDQSDPTELDPAVAAAISDRLGRSILQTKRVIGTTILQVITEDGLQFDDLDRRIYAPPGTCKAAVYNLIEGGDADISVVALLTVAVNRNLNLSFVKPAPKA